MKINQWNEGDSKVEHRKKRTYDVEPVFGNVKFNKGFKRFMLKGCEKVEIEAGLLIILKSGPAKPLLRTFPGVKKHLSPHKRPERKT